MIEYRNVSKIYNDNSCGLLEISTKIEPGEFVSVVGQSGTGKSTFLKMLTREERPSDGRVIFYGVDLSEITKGELPYHRRRIGVIFQDFKLLDNRTAFENVAFALEVAGKPNEEIKKSTAQILDIVGLGEKKFSYPAELSGGEQQRIAIARALVHHPEVLIADEPTGNLDIINTNEVIDLLLKINKLGTTIVLATHDKDTVNRINQRVIAMDEGRIIRDQKHGRYML
ncbi:MAG: ATP-binding cassette domain-containing protein [Candidatus Moranbacteria bacterium]|nr:ATP-binding cassette domain-containing protein [Candidatus Moranbacteria bacterium]